MKIAISTFSKNVFEKVGETLPCFPKGTLVIMKVNLLQFSCKKLDRFETCFNNSAEIFMKLAYIDGSLSLPV